MERSRQRRLRRTHVVMFLAAWYLGSAPASVDAATITLGSISYDSLIPGAFDSDGNYLPGVNGINISNLTGDPLFEDFLPFTPVSFLNSSVTLSTSSDPIDLGTIGPGFIGSFPTLEFSETTVFTSLVFSAALSTTSFLLADGSTFLANSAALSLTLLPSIGDSLVAGVDFGLLTVEGEVIAPIPEPGTLVLLMTGVTGLVVRHRRRSKRSTDGPLPIPVSGSAPQA